MIIYWDMEFKTPEVKSAAVQGPSILHIPKSLL
jgi:hypothetical protein